MDAAPEPRVCPSCAAEVPPESRFCPNDGTPLAPVETPAHDELVRTRFAGLQVVERLGEGSLGVVYRAVDADHESVAIKVLDAALDPDLVERALAEARRASATGHSRLQPVLDAGVEDGRGWLSEPLRGAPVSAPQPLERALSIVGAVASAVAALHRDSLFHLDLRRANVFVDDDEVHLAGAGLRHLLDLDRVPPYVPGTSRADQDHLAPEIFTGKGVTAATDIYLLGALLHELLTGARPFAGGSFLETAERHLGDPPPPLGPDLPQAVEMVVWRCLEKQPPLRFPDIDGLIAALETLAENPTLDALEDLYGARGDAVGVVGVLSRQLQRTEDAAWRVALLQRIADALETRVGDHRAAERAYAAILQEQPDHTDALEALDRLYEHNEQWPELVELLKRRVAGARDDDERAELLARLAALSEHGVDDPDGAFEARIQAFELTADDEAYGVDLERLAKRTERWTDLVAAYDRVIERMGDEPETVPLHLRAAAWFADALDKGDRATRHYLAALAHDPENAAAWLAVEDLQRTHGQLERLAEVLGRRAELSEDHDEQVTALSLKARVLEDELHQPEQAMPVREAIRALEPDLLENLSALEHGYANAENWDALVDVLRQQTELLDGDRRVDAMLRLGRVWQADLRDHERAAEAYEEALELEPESRMALYALESLYAHQGREDDLLALYRRMLPLQSEPRDRRRVLGRMAELLESRDSAERLEVLTELHDIEPADPEVTATLGAALRRREDWSTLAEVWRAHIEATPDPTAERAGRRVLAEIYGGPLNDSTRAAEVLAPIADHPDEAGALVDTFVALERWEDALGLLADAGRWQGEDDPVARVWRCAEICRGPLDDLDRADSWAERVLEERPDHPGALALHADALEARHAWAPLVATLGRLVAASPDSATRSRHLTRLGSVHARRGANEEAADSYREAVDLDPRNTAALRPLAGLEVEGGRWEQAQQTYLRLLDRVDDAEPDVQTTLRRQAALCFEETGDLEAAAAQYERALALDPSDRATLEALGRLSAARSNWARLAEVSATLLQHHGDELTDAQRVEVDARLGTAKAELGEREAAIAHFEQALEADPDHLESLRRLDALYAAERRWDRVVACRTRLIERLDDAEARREGWLRLGDIQLEVLEDAEAARAAYRAALLEAPDDPVVLERLLAVHRARADWHRVVEVIRNLALGTDEPAERAERYMQMAAVLRDEVRDDEAALEAFDCALESDPTRLEALSAVDDILSRTDDLEHQDVFYRRMLRRAIAADLDAELVANLGRALGQINRRLDRPDEAVKAYKVALAKVPTDAESHLELARIYAGRDRIDKAILHHHQRLAIDQWAEDSRHTMFELLHAADRLDPAWCVAAVLVDLGEATGGEQAFYEAHRPHGFVGGRRPLEPEHWAMLSHPDKDPALDELLLAVFPFAAASQISSPEELGLDPEHDRIDARALTPFNRQLTYAARMTGLQSLECYRDPAERAGLRAVNLPPPALLVGADLIGAPTLRTQAYQCARALYLSARQHLLATLCADARDRETHLEAVLQAVRHRIDPAQPGPGHTVLEASMENLPEELLPELRAHLDEMEADVATWIEALDHSANRLGLLLCNDFESAVAAIRADGARYSRAGAEAAVEALRLFALSPQCFQLRAAIGVAISPAS